MIIGNNDYHSSPLSCCVNDAHSLDEQLRRNADGSPNFNSKILTNVNYDDLLYHISELFKGNGDIALLYFSGHGMLTETGAEIIPIDFNIRHCGISMEKILKYVNSSYFKNRIVIFDCCYSGNMGDSSQQCSCSNASNISSLQSGVTILTACSTQEYSYETGSHGIFTNLLLEALRGGAANLRGEITPGAIYSFIDQSLGAWDQRPIFKTNVNSFCSVKRVAPPVSLDIIRKLPEYFPSIENQFPLDPSYEFTNSPDYCHATTEPYANPKHVSVFRDLQQLESVGLIKPISEEHMYFAAMNSKSCGLTALGIHYWFLAKKNLF